MFKTTTCQLVEINKTDFGCVYQCNSKNLFYLEFAGSISYFKISDFLDFTKKVNAIDIAAMAANPARNSDIVILMPHYTERCFVLTIIDILRLKDILNKAKFILQLNSMLRECICSLV